MSNIVIHRADTRGKADYGWLKTAYSFSFSSYYNPERIHFGTLRVLNDDQVAGGAGFSMHPHDNMEIITIVLEGALRHKDNMGNNGVINAGDIQVMSAGTGILHSEANALSNVVCKLLQIWIFPREKNVEPRYDQKTLRKEDRKNTLQQILSPDPDDEGVWIHQDAWFHIAECDAGWRSEYKLKKQNNGIYVFVIKGSIKLGENILNERDGAGVSGETTFPLEALSDTEFLIMEIPMHI
jgi:redox-sensitive bicupin YhaK (pirin superfamily)